MCWGKATYLDVALRLNEVDPESSFNNVARSLKKVSQLAHSERSNQVGDIEHVRTFVVGWARRPKDFPRDFAAITH